MNYSIKPLAININSTGDKSVKMKQLGAIKTRTKFTDKEKFWYNERALYRIRFALQTFQENHMQAEIVPGNEDPIHKAFRWQPCQYPCNIAMEKTQTLYLILETMNFSLTTIIDGTMKIILKSGAYIR